MIFFSNIITNSDFSFNSVDKSSTFFETFFSDYLKGSTFANMYPNFRQLSNQLANGPATYDAFDILAVSQSKYHIKIPLCLI